MEIRWTNVWLPSEADLSVARRALFLNGLRKILTLIKIGNRKQKHFS